jgi:hypothetical protein
MIRLTSALIAQINAARQSGCSYKALSAQFDCSQGTVRNALKAGSAPPSAAPAAAPELAEPALVDDVTHDLAVFEALNRKAVTDGNLAGVATLGRLRVSFLEHRRKAAPPPATPEGHYVTSADAAVAGERAFARLRSMVVRAGEERAAWPKCHACQHPINPNPKVAR